MIYLYAIMGFVLGFLFGLFVINLFLRAYSKSQLVKDKSLRWTYGVAVWIFASLGAWGGVWFYERSVF